MSVAADPQMESIEPGRSDCTACHSKLGGAAGPHPNPSAPSAPSITPRQFNGNLDTMRLLQVAGRTRGPAGSGPYHRDPARVSERLARGVAAVSGADCRAADRRPLGIRGDFARTTVAGGLPTMWEKWSNLFC